MTTEKFAIADDFIQFEIQHEQAVQAVREAEIRTMGIGLETGTQGVCIIGSMTAKKSAKTTNDKGESKGGNPMVLMQFEVVQPETKKGHKMFRNFIFTYHEKYTDIQKYQDWLDFMEKAGLPREVRVKGTSAIVAWASEAPRSFPFEVIEDKYGDDQNRNIVPVVGSTNVLPTATSTAAALAPSSSSGPTTTTSGPDPVFSPGSISGPTTTSSAPPAASSSSAFSEGDMIKFAGQDFMVKTVLNDKEVRIVNPSNMKELTVPMDNCRPA